MTIEKGHRVFVPLVGNQLKNRAQKCQSSNQGKIKQSQRGRKRDFLACSFYSSNSQKNKRYKRPMFLQLPVRDCEKAKKDTGGILDIHNPQMKEEFDSSLSHKWSRF